MKNLQRILTLNGDGTGGAGIPAEHTVSHELGVDKARVLQLHSGESITAITGVTDNLYRDGHHLLLERIIQVHKPDGFRSPAHFHNLVTDLVVVTHNCRDCVVTRRY